MKLPPVRMGAHERAYEVPYMRYGHTAVLLDDSIYLWGGRNDTEGACDVLYAFDVGKLTCIYLTLLNDSFRLPILEMYLLDSG